MTLSVAITKRQGAFSLDTTFQTGGGVTALFGRSGAGKTTVIDLIAGLRRPDAGRIALDGETLFDAAAGIDRPPHRRRIGYVFQDDRLFPHLTVRRNLTYAWRHGRVAAAPKRLDDVVDLLGLDALMERRPAGLSGGERQRIAIGRALLAAPRLLLMDEPLANLDTPRRAEILPYLERLNTETGVPIVYVSHNIDEVARLADDLVVLSDGRVAAAGPAAEVLGRTDLMPLTGRFEAGAVLAATVLDHDEAAAMSRLRLAGTGDTVPPILVPRLDLEVGQTVRLRVRARDVAIALTPPEGISIRNILPATVTETIEGEPPFVTVAMALPSESGSAPILLASLTAAAVADLGLRPGLPVQALIKSAAIDRRTIARAAAPSLRDAADTLHVRSEIPAPSIRGPICRPTTAFSTTSPSWRPAPSASPRGFGARRRRCLRPGCRHCWRIWTWCRARNSTR